MLLCILLMTDFTFKAYDDMWIDYARSGRLSENRYLIHQYHGKKGTYDKGAQVLILDQHGDELYRINSAENAWLIRNGVMQSEDLYLFQNRDDQTWYLWHDQFGVTPIEGDLNLGRNGNHATRVSEKGNIYFLSIHEAFVEVEELLIINQTIESIFVDGLQFSHRSHRLEGKPEIASSENGFYLYYEFIPPKYTQPVNYLYYEFDQPDGSKIENIHLGLNFLRLRPLGTWFLLYQDPFGLIFHDGDEPIFVFSSEDQNSSKQEDAARAFFTLLNKAAGKSALHQKDQKLSFIYDGKLYEFDRTQFTFNIYSLPGKWHTIKGWRHPLSNPVIQVNHKRMKVMSLPQYQTKNMIPDETIKLDERFSPNNRNFQLDQNLPKQK